MSYTASRSVRPDAGTTLAAWQSFILHPGELQAVLQSARQFPLPLLYIRHLDPHQTLRSTLDMRFTETMQCNPASP